MKNTLAFFSARPAAPEHAALRITDETEACAAVLVACLYANELGYNKENATFHATIRSRNIFKGHDTGALIDAAEKYLETAGSPAGLINAAIGAIREQLRLPLFYHCLDVILADGVVTPREHKVFQYLKGKFHVSDEAAFQAMEVLVAKNQL